jgi:stage III sporulation protein SpoIIIAA
MREAEAILAVKGCGVPIVASAHAATTEELLNRPPIAAPVEGGVFAAFIGITRQGNEFFYSVQATGEEKCRCFAS